MPTLHAGLVAPGEECRPSFLGGGRAPLLTPWALLRLFIFLLLFPSLVCHPRPPRRGGALLLGLAAEAGLQQEVHLHLDHRCNVLAAALAEPADQHDTPAPAEQSRLLQCVQSGADAGEGRRAGRTSSSSAWCFCISKTVVFQVEPINSPALLFSSPSLG